MKIAVVRVRGRVNVNKKIEGTMEFLHLKYKNNCNVVDDTPNYRGMLQKAKDYITFGEIEKETFRELLIKRGRLIGDKRVTDESFKPKFNSIAEFIDAFFEGKVKLKEVNLKLPFRLAPPSKGFEKKGIKKPYTLGGALGNRGKDINELLLRMI